MNYIIFVEYFFWVVAIVKALWNSLSCCSDGS